MHNFEATKFQGYFIKAFVRYPKLKPQITEHFVNNFEI